MRGRNSYFDPESLLTGAEIAKGFTYSNSHRQYPDEAVRQAIIRGIYKTSEIPEIAPRVFNEGYSPTVKKDSFNNGHEEDFSI